MGQQVIYTFRFSDARQPLKQTKVAVVAQVEHPTIPPKLKAQVEHAFISHKENREACMCRYAYIHNMYIYIYLFNPTTLYFMPLDETRHDIEHTLMPTLNRKTERAME